MLVREGDGVAEVKRQYKLKPRQQIGAEGVEAPQELLAAVLEELLNTRWHTCSKVGHILILHRKYIDFT